MDGVTPAAPLKTNQLRLSESLLYFQQHRRGRKSGLSVLFLTKTFPAAIVPPNPGGVSQT